MVDLEYDPSSFCGAVDMRVAKFLEEYRGHKLDSSYLRHVQKYHGGVPGKGYFDAEDGKTYRVGRFLTLFDEDSELEPPSRPSWEFPERDIRIDWSVLTLIDQEGPSCRQLFDKLLPFAALYRGKLHPDKMSLTRADCDLACFHYKSKKGRPRVAVWLSTESANEYLRWEAAGCDEVRYDEFVVPVATDFDAFLEMLRAKP
jgi:hypothetical protein